MSLHASAACTNKLLEAEQHPGEGCILAARQSMTPRPTVADIKSAHMSATSRGHGLLQPPMMRRPDGQASKAASNLQARSACKSGSRSLEFRWFGFKDQGSFWFQVASYYDAYSREQNG